MHIVYIHSFTYRIQKNQQQKQKHSKWSCLLKTNQFLVRMIISNMISNLKVYHEKLPQYD